MIIILIILLINIIANWIFFQWNFKPGWASIVPIYNFIILLDILNRPRREFFLMLIPFYNIYRYYKLMQILSQISGKSYMFGLGLFFFNFLFFPILVFGKNPWNIKKIELTHISKILTSPNGDILSNSVINIRPSIYQTLDMLYMMRNNSNYNLVIKYYRELKDVQLPTLINKCIDTNYANILQSEILSFKKDNPDYAIEQKEIYFLKNPSIDNLKDIYCDMLFNSFRLFYDKKIYELSQLQRESAIKNRKDKFEQFCFEVTEELRIECSGSSSLDMNLRVLDTYCYDFQNFQI